MTKTGNAISTNEYRSSTQLQDLREQSGLTQEEAAVLLYVSVKKYRNWEYGVTLLPRAIYEFFEIRVKDAKAAGLL